MANLSGAPFETAAFLAMAGTGRLIVRVEPKVVLFRQGDPADSTFYIQQGSIKITAVSAAGKEAAIALLSKGDFIGEGAVAALPSLRVSSATAVTNCTLLRIDRPEIIRVIHEEHEFSDLFVAFMLARSIRSQDDLLDQLFNFSDKRLARILLSMAEISCPGQEEALIPPVTQAALSEMVGTTRSRTSFFMNRFRTLGLIEYEGRILVRRARLVAFLRDR